MPRSFLYVSADRPDHLAKAAAGPAGALIIDLEDAVAPERKDAARAALGDWLDADVPAPPIWVRVNAGPRGLEDLAALGDRRRIAGFCLAKTEGAATVGQAAAVLDGLGSNAGLAPILEDPAAVFEALAIAGAPRVTRLQLGEADLRASTGVITGPEEVELVWPRSQVVFASAAAGIEPPLGPVSTDFRNLAGLRESTLRLRRLGFRGRACIHPAQLPVVDEVFAPSEAELARARELLAGYRTAATVGADGTMVDEAVARMARRLLSE